MNQKIEWETFEDSVKHFDYTYMMSDDSRVWGSGRTAGIELQKLINKMAKIDFERTKQIIAKHKSEYGLQFTLEKE